MAKLRAQIRIERSADDVWAVIGDFGDLRWNPKVATLHLAGNVRTTTMVGQPDIEIDEREVGRDDAARTYSYDLSEFRGNTVMELPGGHSFDLNAISGHLLATITVEPDGPSASNVLYDLEMDEGHDATAPATLANYQACIEGLKRQLEG
jgi:hypothetical protein